MKNLICMVTFFALIPKLFLGAQTQPNAISTEDNIAIVLRMYEQFDKGDLDGYAEFVDANFVANVLGTTTLDWTGFKQFGSAFLTAFPDGRHVFDYVVADGENVVTIGNYKGTHQGDMQGIQPTNAPLSLPVMHLDRVVNGKIVEHRGLANELDFMRQLGIIMVPKEDRDNNK
jgi:predicted ester cyclase